MDLKSSLLHTGQFVKRHLPAILTIAGVAGVGATAFLTGKATLRARELVEEAEKEKGDLLTTKEIVKVAYKPYIPAALAGLATSACIIGANRSSAEQLAAVITAAKTMERELKDNRAAINDIYGEHGLRKVDEKLNENNLAKYSSGANTIYETGKGEVLCCEGFLTGTMFRANVEWVKKCVNDFNARLLDGEGLSYNEFLEMLIPTIDGNTLPTVGWWLGYNHVIDGRMLRIVGDTFLNENDIPVYIFRVADSSLPLKDYTNAIRDDYDV